ncbi:MAG: SSU ribosomal protein S8p (S15Ae) [uncultured Campylobacterales bacterium]|uniref:Small ribosomal subunit protein uS8 n=1 Tax=uncultured Campylobacterales bacterium TaxID=352960 RepID=A0A6S6SI21_9BACT|nr:MAG: SSU ribosomal protein S8p (S15Ae) [uncultured Campylobacterales bacterium]
MINDIVADGLTRIRNAAVRKLDTTVLAHSRLIESVVGILKDKGYIDSYKVIGENIKTLKVVLKYDENSNTVLNELKKISKPGRRVYKPCDEIKSFKNGYGSFIISTSQGVLSNDEAYKLGIGGEVIASVW